MITQIKLAEGTLVEYSKETLLNNGMPHNVADDVDLRVKRRYPNGGVVLEEELNDWIELVAYKYVDDDGKPLWTPSQQSLPAAPMQESIMRTSMAGRRRDWDDDICEACQ